MKIEEGRKTGLVHSPSFIYSLCCIVKLAVLLIFILHKSDAADAVRERECVCVCSWTDMGRKERARAKL